MRLITVLLLLITQLTQAQNKAHRIDSLLQSMHQEGRLNGCVLVAEKGKVIYKGSFGYANEETRQKLDENSIFELASVSKQFTAMAIVMLQEKGKLCFDDPVSKYIPELAAYKNVTLRHLLNHTSGLPDYMIFRDTFFDKAKIATNRDVVEILQKHQPPLDFEPGTQWHYSNTGYDLLAVVVDRVSGMPFEDFLKKYIFSPLKMNNTFVYARRLAPKQLDNYAYGYVYSNRLNKYVLPDNEENSRFVVYLDGIHGAGAVNSTIMDLFKWDRALYTHKLVSEAGMKEIFKDPGVTKVAAQRYGFGWFLEEFADLGKIVNHSGGWPGYQTFIDRHIDKDKTIIVLLNHDDGLIPLQGIRQILDDKPFLDPKNAISVPDSILNRYVGGYQTETGFASIEKKPDGCYLFQNGNYFRMYFSSNVDFFNVEYPSTKRFVTNDKGQVTGYQRFYFGSSLQMSLKINRLDTIHAEAQFFNIAGWHYLEQRQFDEGLRYLKRSEELYPEELFTQGNLAHAYLFKNQHDKAITIYKKYLGKEVQQGYTWADMIKQDFDHFKGLGFDAGMLDKVLSELGL